jgi:putative transposase
VTASWWQRKADESYGVPEAELTPWRPWSLPALRKVFNEAKKTDPRFADWWDANSKEAYGTGLANAAAAFDNYAKSKQGKRKGRSVGMPRRKSKHKARPACRFTTGTIRVESDRRHVTLPRLGTIRTRASFSAVWRTAAPASCRPPSGWKEAAGSSPSRSRSSVPPAPRRGRTSQWVWTLESSTWR